VAGVVWERFGNVANYVEQWCIENGENPRFRIALCGYEGTHDKLELLGWEVYKWKSSTCFQTTSSYKTSRNSVNRGRERIWFSPHCLKNNDIFG
ncbi:MAG TPA: hypothetical protein PK650_13055, partial [Candidatus Sumerlaeota bacterium]|nr:hypothetical protein [Candidatus Sumerlaeota bacterium]